MDSSFIAKDMTAIKRAPVNPEPDKLCGYGKSHAFGRSAGTCFMDLTVFKRFVNIIKSPDIPRKQQNTIITFCQDEIHRPIKKA